MAAGARWAAALAVALACAGASAQTAQTAQTASTPAKKELAARIVQVQIAGVDQLARQLVEQPAVQMLQRAASYVQARVPADQRDAMARELQADVRKYVDETQPIVRQRARALAPATLGPVLEEKFTEGELKEILAVLESPAWKKFQGVVPDLEKALGEKLVADTKGQVEPRLKALEQAMGKHMGLSAAASAPPARK